MVSPFLFILIGALGWPLLAFVLCRYQFRVSHQWTLRLVIFAFAVAGVVAIGLGDNMVSLERTGRSGASLFLVRGIVFAFPYVALAIWLAIRTLARIRHERSTPTI
jgi:hypothetical protein